MTHHNDRYEVEFRRKHRMSFDSAGLAAATRQWTLIANGADPTFAAKHGYIADGQCMEAVQDACINF